MSDERPSDSTGDAQSDPSILANLDEVLAQAASLADDLSVEVGTSDDPQPEQADTTASEASADASESTNTSVDEVPEVAGASDEINEGLDEEDPSNQAVPTDATIPEESPGATERSDASVTDDLVEPADVQPDTDATSEAAEDATGENVGANDVAPVDADALDESTESTESADASMDASPIVEAVLEASEQSPDEDSPSTGAPPGEASAIDESVDATESSDEPVTDALDASSASSPDAASEETSEASGTSDDFPPADTDLDNELAELERLVGTVSDEIDADAVEATNENSEGASDEPSDTPTRAAPEVPDFMSEFTEAEEPAVEQGSVDATDGTSGGGDPHTTTVSAVADSKQGVVSSSMLGVVGTASTADDPSEEATDEANSTEETEPEEVPLIGRLKASVAAPLSKVAFRGATVVAGVCEQVDRPFTRLKAPLRRGLGYLAIATFGTAVLAFMLSLV